jgi:hypothetical protein
MRRVYDGETTKLVVRVPKDVRRRLRVHCLNKDITVIEFVTEAVDEALHGKASRRPKPSAPKSEE